MERMKNNNIPCVSISDIANSDNSIRAIKDPIICIKFKKNAKTPQKIGKSTLKK